MSPKKDHLQPGEVPPPVGKLPPIANLFFDWEIERHLDGTMIVAGDRSICRMMNFEPVECEALARLLVATPRMLRNLERLSKIAGDDPELDDLLRTIKNAE